MVKLDRKLPSLRTIRELTKGSASGSRPKSSPLDRAVNIEDLRRIARRRVPRAVFDYTDGAAESESSLDRARQAFANLEFRPDVLQSSDVVDTSIDVLGVTSELPFGIAPTGFTRFMHVAGERAGATAAGAAGIPFTLSTLGTATVETVQAANPAGRNWFQLYIMRDRDATYELIERASAAEFDTLLITVDTPVAGQRVRDIRNGLTIPPKLKASTVLGAAPHVRWWFDLLTTEPLQFASLSSTNGTVAELLDAAMDPGISIADVIKIRGLWDGNLVIKGVQTVDDAVKLADLGVDGIVLSSHGGRQLDRAPVPLEVLPRVAREVGHHTTIMLDTGILSGADIVASLALGARFTLIGRAYLYGLMAGGARGVSRAIEILRGEIERTMKLLGVSSLDELTERHISLRA